MAQARRVIGRRKMCRFGLGVMGRGGVRAAVACALRKAPCELWWPASGTAFMGRSGPHPAGLFAGCADLYLTGPFAGRGWVHPARLFVGRSDPHPTEPFMG